MADNTACSNKHITANGYSGHDERIVADIHIIAYLNFSETIKLWINCTGNLTSAMSENLNVSRYLTVGTDLYQIRLGRRPKT